jgi:hypothetical protein
VASPDRVDAPANRGTPPGDQEPAPAATAGRLGPMLVVVVAVLAFLLASFPARNSDLWAHLAAGRSLVHGGPSPDAAPGLSAELRADHTWLYDVLCYGLYSAVGGTGLVLVKALLVAGLALVLLRLSRTGQGWWIPAACTALALLAIGTRLLLQPATVSYLFLALALWAALGRADEGGPSAGRRAPLAGLVPPWPLLLLFVVWANTDSWFVLGLGVVALVWLGQALDSGGGREERAAGGAAGALGRVAVRVLILAAVCLLNPSHVGAFAPPPELGWSSAAAGGPRPVMSPFQTAYLTGPGLSPAGLAYFPLLGLGMLAFVLNRRGWRWQWFLPWLGLALLSAVRVRTAPFFAVVAGPALAWNLQALLERRATAAPLPAGLVAGRALAVLVLLALPACAWPGWLQIPPYEPRRWAVDTPSSLERGAAALRRWHQEGKLGPDARGLHLSPETARAFAWFCPEEKAVQDERLAATVVGGPGAAEDWDRRLRDAGITHVVVYDPDRDRLFAALERLLAAPDLWPLLYLEGDLAVFGWRDPAVAADPFRGWELDPDRLAFHPAEDRWAPRGRPEREPAARPWWEAFWKPAPPRPVERDEAALYLFQAEARRRTAPFRHQAAWEASQSAGLVAAAGGPPGPAGLLDAALRLELLRPQVPPAGSGVEALPALDRQVLALQQAFSRERDDAPPALLYLAVRAARRALAVNPADAQAHLILGESYLRLLHSTRERTWVKRLPELADLRRAQASTALNRAVALKPDLARAHLGLVGLYHEMGFLDLELQHLQTYVTLAHQAGPPPGVDAEQFAAEETRFQEQLSRLKQEVEDRTNAYDAGSANLRVLDRAQLASQKGLAGKARDLLLGSDVSAFGTPGTLLELQLLLKTGRADDVRDWAPDQQAALGAAAYHWLRARALAATGDYGLAEEESDQLARALATGDREQKSTVRPRERMALLVAQALLEERPGAEGVPSLLWRAWRRGDLHKRVTDLAWGMRQEADATVLRGLLALEQGDVGEAEVAFRVALALWRDETAAASGAGLDFGGRVIAQDGLDWLEQEARMRDEG